MAELLQLLAPNERVVRRVADLHHRPGLGDYTSTPLLFGAGRRDRGAIIGRAAPRDAGWGCQASMAVPAMAINLAPDAREIDRPLGPVVCTDAGVALVAADGTH